MPNKTGATTKARLAESAWKLFYEKGYDNTTIEDILLLSLFQGQG